MSLTAITPTVLELAGAGRAPTGSSLLDPREVAPEEPAYSLMRKKKHPKYPFPIDRVSVRRDGWTLIQSRAEPVRSELVRTHGGAERSVRLEEHREIANDLRRLLESRYPQLGSAGEDGGPDLSERERDLLQSLGYVE